MGCEEFRDNLELITSLDDNNENFKATIEHLKGCPKCVEDFTTLHSFDKILTEKMADVPVPPYLGARIKANVRQLSSLHQPVKKQLAYIWGALLLVGGLIFYNQIKIISRLDQISLALPQQNSLSSTNLTANHVSSYNAILQLVTSHAIKRHKNVLGSKFVVFEDTQLGQTFQKKFSFPVVTPAFANDMNFVGGNKCHSCNYEMAYLLYRQGQESVSLCIFPASQIGLAGWEGKAQTISQNLHNVIIWKKQDNVYAMVFQLPVEKVRALVGDLQEMR